MNNNENNKLIIMIIKNQAWTIMIIKNEIT